VDRRDREMLKRAERQNRWLPGDDEFDLDFKGSKYVTWLPWVAWMAIVRGVRQLRRQTP
jgi:hypothetical protein